MRIIVLFMLAALAVPGQEQKPDLEKQEKPAVTQEASEPKAEGQQKEAGEAAQPAAQDDAEKVIFGDIDVGWRFRTDVGGDMNTYRTVVNQGEGPSLLGADLTIQPNVGWMDRMRIIMTSWGPDPYRTARFDIEQQRLYRLTVDYRDFAYFDFLPSFANPLRDAGVFATQRGWDLTRRSTDAELTLLPTSHIVPYLAYSRGSGDGRGVQNFVASRNEYTLPSRLYDRANNFRGGVRLEFNRVHATFEQGWVRYRDEQELFPGSVLPNFGTTPVSASGRPLFLDPGYQVYGMRGNAPFTRVMATASPWNWINLTGAFLFSQPETDVNFAQVAAGNLVSGATVFQGQMLLATARSIQPHPSGTITAELRPISRLRVFESFMTDRQHTAGSVALAETLLTAALTNQPLNTTGLERLVSNYNQNEINALFDLTPRITLRGGHRYVWGDSEVPPSIAATSINLNRQFGELKRHVGLGGLTWRTRDKLSVTADFEGASSDRSYFRTSLHDYQRGRFQARYQVSSSLNLSARFNVLNNDRPRPVYPAAGPELGYSFLSRDNTVTLFWNPSSGKYFSVLADYSRTTFKSKTDYLDPTSPLDTFLSEYRENAHIGTLLVDLPIRVSEGVAPKLQVGGSFYRASGSRPSRYYQPMAKVAVPFGRWVEWHFDWRYYGLTQPFYLYEGFRAHNFVTGLRFKL
ncbi:MAG TPA: hypothetical protein VN428_22440 [Bryobacteraceae bacterium]|nr:hypothetical protein [Bryobacteraceae bacterium]